MAVSHFRVEIGGSQEDFHELEQFWCQDQVSWDFFPLLPLAFQKEASCSISLQASSEVFQHKDYSNFSKKLLTDVFTMCRFLMFSLWFLNSLVDFVLSRLVRSFLNFSPCRRFGRSCCGAGGGRTGDPCGFRRCSKDTPLPTLCVAEMKDGFRWMTIGRGKDDRIIMNHLQYPFLPGVERFALYSFRTCIKRWFCKELCKKENCN